MMTSSEPPTLFLVFDSGKYASSDGALLCVSLDFFEACKSAYDANQTEILIFQDGKTTKIARATPHWHFFTLDIYNPFKYKLGDPVQFRDGKGNLRIGNIDEQSIHGGKKPFPPFDPDVVEYHANGYRVMEKEIKLLNINDSEAAE